MFISFQYFLKLYINRLPYYITNASIYKEKNENIVEITLISLYFRLLISKLIVIDIVYIKLILLTT